MGSLNFKVINNFLEKEIFDNFKNILMSKEINWFFMPHMLANDKYFFVHCFYNDHVPKSAFFENFIIPIIKKLNVKALIEVKANLLIKDNSRYQSTFHVDRYFDCKTAIFYVNTCNGYTLLDEEKKIKVNCEENKMLIFDSQIKHSAVSQTDEDRRIVINFNYF